MTFKPPAEYKPDNAWAAEVYERLKSDKRLGTTAQERQNQLLRGGLKIYSTLDLGLQADAQRAVDTAQKRKGFELSVVGLDPKTGQVKAMANSFPFAVTQYNLATHIPGMQPGSTYKTITLAAALEAGFSPNDTVDGTSPCKLPHHPESLSNAEPGGGIMPVRSATEESVNCAFLRIATALGPEKIVAMANRMGIHIPRANNPDQFVAVPTITLGAIEATPLEMAGVGGILANDGVRHAPIFVTKVLDSEGNVVFEQNESPAEQVIDPDIASCETDVLRGVITHGTGSGLSFSHVAAGKTGTTDNKVRAWFVGYTPQLAASVAYGNPDDNRTPGAGFGAQVPGHTWRTFMQSALADQPEDRVSGRRTGLQPAGPLHRPDRTQAVQPGTDPAAADLRPATRHHSPESTAHDRSEARAAHDSEARAARHEADHPSAPSVSSDGPAAVRLVPVTVRRTDRLCDRGPYRAPDCTNAAGSS